MKVGVGREGEAEWQNETEDLGSERLFSIVGMRLC